MLKKILILLHLSGLIFAQQQTDIPWPTLASTDWPMIKHDPQFTGRSPYKGPQTATVIWSRNMPHGIFSGPVIGEEGNLFFGSYYRDSSPPFTDSSDYFYSYTSDGGLIWQFRAGSGDPPQTGILIDSSYTIYFGSRDNYLYALKPDGKLKWKFKTNSELPEGVIPNIDLQGNIYISALEGKLYSIKPDGTLNWVNSYENGPWNTTPAFSPDGNTMYLASGDSNIFAINLDGSVKWKFSCGRVRWAPLVDSDGNIYFSAKEVPQYFYSLKNDGSVRWKYLIQDTWAPDNYSIPTIDYSGNISFIGRDPESNPPSRSALFQLNYNGEFRWKYVLDELNSDEFTQPLICDSEGTIYVGSTFGLNYYAVSSEGQLKWKMPLTEQYQQVDNTGAISKDGTLFIGVHNVLLYLNAAETLIAIKDTGTVSVNEFDPPPAEYNLYQNYPNPFNPQTTIKYQIPEAGFVTLRIYDILGKEVAILVNENKNTGRYTASFDGRNLASGIYIYSIRVNSFVSTKKMMFVK